MRDFEYDDEPYVVIERRSGSASSFIWGLALGAGIALLLAPQTGEETRRRIGVGARRARQKALETADELTDSVLDRYEQARRTVEDRIDDARQAIDLKRRQAQRAIEAGRRAAEDARDELERRIAETKVAYQGGSDATRARRRPARRPAAARETAVAEPEGTPGESESGGGI